MKIDKDAVISLSFGALNLADYLATRRILSTGGEELNPVADFLMRKKCFGVFKTVTTLAGMVTIYSDELPETVSKALLGYYGIIVGLNVKEIVQYEWEIRKEKEDQDII